MIKIGKRQKKSFYQFVIDSYTLSLDELKVKYKKMMALNPRDFDEISNYGFCLLMKIFFHCDFMYGEDVSDDFPELYKHKPTKFYTKENKLTDDDSQFWFPIGGDQTERIEIAKKILADLK